MPSLPPPSAPTDRFARLSFASRPNRKGSAHSSIRSSPACRAPIPARSRDFADAVGGRAGDEAYRAFHRELYDWIVRYVRDVEPGSLRADEIGELWDRIRDADRETEALNLDRKLHILTLFAEIAATAPGR